MVYKVIFKVKTVPNTMKIEANSFKEAVEKFKELNITDNFIVTSKESI